MQPLASFKPPPINAENEAFFCCVHGALNDIDRTLYLPIRTLRERHNALLAAYDAVEKRFGEESRTLGLADWLRFTILNRRFGLTAADKPMEEIRHLYEEMERLGYPEINPLMTVRMIWANRLADDGEPNEARIVAQPLLADVEEIHRRFPNKLDTHFGESLQSFRLRHDV